MHIGLFRMEFFTTIIGYHAGQPGQYSRVSAWGPWRSLGVGNHEAGATIGQAPAAASY